MGFIFVGCRDGSLVLCSSSDPSSYSPGCNRPCGFIWLILVSLFSILIFPVYCSVPYFEIKSHLESMDPANCMIKNNCSTTLSRVAKSTIYSVTCDVEVNIGSEMFERKAYIWGTANALYGYHRASRANTVEASYKVGDVVECWYAEPDCSPISQCRSVAFSNTLPSYSKSNCIASIVFSLFLVLSMFFFAVCRKREVVHVWRRT
mmetsp:Transcript_30201/g.39801  ORF Transcript_30201/g.39801 Transcript_30201/m.39801 type:complete len:205 (+) Transcript_30201:157-771(+)